MVNEVFQLLLADIYALCMLNEKQHMEQFIKLSRLAKQILLHWFDPSDDLDRLDKSVEVILRHLAKRSS